MLLQLAWRNVWRNKRRTFITISAIAFGVFFAAFMTAFNKGIFDSMMDGAIQQYFGYAQIHGANYWEDKVIDNSIEFTADLQAIPQKVAEVQAIIPRMETFALASAGERTNGAFVIGIEPTKENDLTNIAGKIIEGEYLTPTDEAVIIAEGLAKKLGLGLSDTLILISQGYHGVNAAGKYPIKGIFKMGLPDLNKTLVYMPIQTTAYFLGAEGRATTLVLKIDKAEQVPQAIAGMQQYLPANQPYAIKSWQALMPELVETRQLKEGGNIVFISILYLLISFAIFGTILMMTKERSYEFGVLTAIGMRRKKLFSIIWLETIMVAIVGAIVGILMSMPIIYYLKVKPITVAMLGEEAAAAYEKFGLQGNLPAAFELPIFFNQALIIFLITSILAIYPWFKIMKLKPVEAMRD